MAIVIHAPAKLNLYLHITGKRDDGYHLLDSLTAPVHGIADVISIAAAPSLSLTLSGPFAPLIAHEAMETNLAVRAARALAAHLGRPADIAITLEKNIPPGAGLGGGSSDAAATLRALLQLWNATIDNASLARILNTLGSDVAACYADAPVIMRGVGDELIPAPVLPPLPVVLVYPGVLSPTPAAYKNYVPPFSAPVTPPALFRDDASAIEFISRRTNDLTGPAMMTVPVIQDVLDTLMAQDGIRLARMTGSGSACFGIFSADDAAQAACDAISRSSPTSWWVRRGVLSSRH